MDHKKSSILFCIKGFIQIISIVLILFFTSSVTAREVNLAWEASNDPNLSCYIVYWGANPGEYSSNSGNIGLVTSHQVDIPDNGQIYYFAVTAVDSTGQESDFSNEVSTGSTMVISVMSNWNLISIPNVSEITNIQDALEPIMDDVISIWTYVDGRWQLYDPANPYISNLFEVKSGQGLWVNMRGNAKLYVMGGASADSVSLAKGWNLVGSSSSSPKDMTDVISSIAENVKSVWAYQQGQWKVYDPSNPEFSDLTTMEPGFGYWINVKTSCLWTR